MDFDVKIASAQDSSEEKVTTYSDQRMLNVRRRPSTFLKCPMTYL